ncbi:MAG: preprotein translocase subunit YajC [Bacteriovoracaceae bacterium]|nr:preprotein translocase subunit YajC [Bacteriovoracaceae bacterium]
MNLSFFISDALAQAAPAAAPAAAPGGAPAPSPVMGIAPIIIVFVIFYFILIRPQQKRMKQEQLMLKALKVGDEVYTKSGFLGTITGLSDHVATLDMGNNNRMKILRSEIGGLASKLFAQANNEAAKK